MTRFTKTLSRNVLVPALAVAGLALMAGNASALSLSVKLACASDYYAHCSQHSPGGSAVRGCMRRAGPKLSNRCVNALIGAGEVSAAEVARRRAKSRTASR